MSNNERKVWMVCYDIRDSARLRAVYKVMRSYGDHLQYSVFRCLVSARQLVELKGELMDKIDASEDQVLFVPLGRPGKGHDAGMFTLGTPLVHVERICHVV